MPLCQSMRWRTAARLTFGLLLIAALLYRFDPAAVFSTVRSANPALLLLAPAVYSITFLILSMRWRRILHALGEDLPISDALPGLCGRHDALGSDAWQDRRPITAAAGQKQADPE